jgi:hypothetical protein
MLNWRAKYGLKREVYFPFHLRSQNQETLMTYFERNTGWSEQLGKLIGDALAAAMIISVVALALSAMVR